MLWTTALDCAANHLINVMALVPPRLPSFFRTLLRIWFRVAPASANPTIRPLWKVVKRAYETTMSKGERRSTQE